MNGDSKSASQRGQLQAVHKSGRSLKAIVLKLIVMSLSTQTQEIVDVGVSFETRKDH